MNQLTVQTEVVSKELSILVDSKLMTVEAQQKLALAVATAQTMKVTSTPVGQRHFNKIDTMLSLKNPTPASQARECLAVVDGLWASVRGDFHRFREMHLQTKVLRARLNKRRKEVETLQDEDDRTIAEAECALDQAKIDTMEAELAANVGKFQHVLSKATAQADRYALICKQAGKEFTDADFLDEETIYLIKSAWWHAAQTFTTFDRRNAQERQKTAVGPNASVNAQFWATRKAREFMSIDIAEEVLIYFQGLGISEAEVRNEIAEIERTRHYHEDIQRVSEGARQPFRPYFEAWVSRMAEKYKARVLAAIQAVGMDQLRRINSLVTPTDRDEGGPGDVGTMSRGSLFK